MGNIFIIIILCGIILTTSILLIIAIVNYFSNKKKNKYKKSLTRKIVIESHPDRSVDDDIKIAKENGFKPKC